MFRYILLLVFIACSTPSPTPPLTLRTAFASAPSAADPRTTGDFLSGTLVCLTREGLTRCLSDGSVELAVAQKIEESSDKKTYLFHLRKTVWPDQSLVTAFDFERCWKENIKMGSPCPCAYLFFPILNAELASKGIAPLDTVGIKALGPFLLQVTLEKPTPYFVSLTASPSFLPVHKEGLNIGSNGPYQMESQSLQKEIVLKKNRHYWNEQRIEIEQIIIQILPDENTILSLFEKGELDWIGGSLAPLPNDALETLQGQSELQFHPVAASTFCTFNTSQSPFNNRRLRQAFGLAIAREKFATHHTVISRIAATRCIPPILCKEPRTIIPSFNLETAKQYFEEGLQQIGKTRETLGPITLSYRPGTPDKVLAQIIQREWEEAFGIEVQLKKSDLKSHQELLHQRKYQAALASWIAQYQDPMNILERFKSKHNWKNYPDWEDPLFVHSLNQAEEATDPNQREAWLLAAEIRLLEEMPLLPLFHWSQPVLCQPWIHNVELNPSGAVLFEKGRIDLQF